MTDSEDEMVELLKNEMLRISKGEFFDLSGIDVDTRANAVEQYAKSIGIETPYEEMTPELQARLRYTIILKAYEEKEA